jgi:hypothetical protein
MSPLVGVRRKRRMALDDLGVPLKLQDEGLDSYFAHLVG